MKKIKDYKYVATLKFSGAVSAVSKKEAKDLIREYWNETDEAPDDCEIKVELDK